MSHSKKHASLSLSLVYPGCVWECAFGSYLESLGPTSGRKGLVMFLLGQPAKTQETKLLGARTQEKKKKKKNDSVPFLGLPYILLGGRPWLFPGARKLHVPQALVEAMQAQASELLRQPQGRHAREGEGQVLPSRR